MEDKLVQQLKRIYYDTQQAISECTFLSKHELDQILLTPSEEESISKVDGSQISLIKAATLLRELHARFLRSFVLTAFDLTWDIITTPKRFEYAKKKELELYYSLMQMNFNQDEMKKLIRESVLSTFRMNSNSNHNCTSIGGNSNIVSNHRNNHHHLHHNQNNHFYHQNYSTANSNEQTNYNTISCSSNNNSNNNNNNNDPNGSYHNSNCIDNDIEIISSRQEIEEFVERQLKSSITNKLVSSVESLRSSYVETLERCLASLEQNCIDSNEQPHSLLALRQILNAAYRVEVNVQSSTSLLRVFWEKMKQLFTKSFANLTIVPSFWLSSYGVIDDQWKRQQAMEILERLDETRLAKTITIQFRQSVRLSHEQFLQSIKDLEAQHSSRLQHAENLRLRLRKMHAPRMAKYALESTSLIDLILYGMPCLEKEIGRGQYGVVYACESWAGHSPCAVKSVVPPDDKHWYDLAMEFYYTRCIPEHDRIVSIYGSIIDHSYGSGSTPAVLLIMQRLNRDLYSAIKSGLDWLLRLQIAIDVVEGIRFLHNQGLVHRDIKLKNILLDENNRAKITDLGFCKPEAMMSGSVVGTPIHMSPELFSGRYDNSVDVYAFGILFWYICAGHVRLPHIFEQCQTRDQLWNCVRRGVRPERLPQFDNECWQLMASCWDGDRSKRPHLGDVEIKLRQIYARYT